MEQVVFPSNTMLGAMAKYVSSGGTREFVPMNANFGIIDPLEYRVKGGKKFKYEAIAERALAAVKEIADKYSLSDNVKE